MKVLLACGIITVVVAAPVILFYCGVRFVFENRCWNLTYPVHDGSDPAREYVKSRGVYRRLTYHQFAGEIHTILASHGVPARDLEYVDSRVVIDLVDAKWRAAGSRPFDAGRAGVAEYVYVQGGKVYLNERYQVGQWGAVIMYPLFPKPTCMCDAAEVHPGNWEVSTPDGARLMLEILAREPGWPDAAPGGSPASP